MSVEILEPSGQRQNNRLFQLADAHGEIAGSCAHVGHFLPNGARKNSLEFGAAGGVESRACGIYAFGREGRTEIEATKIQLQMKMEFISKILLESRRCCELLLGVLI
ncbi:hypothetical protein CFC21_034121 [Triticum aestivum]|uniref:Uncharacterized protein n=2 Tax=Triticum aestivum TaxID=4565 RepID=A0A9R1JL10_WHEAT|nr:hypothetical protein CFC21_034121 [Triticum aestivum]